MFAALSERAVKHATQALMRSEQWVLLYLCRQLFSVEHAVLARECPERARSEAVACMNAAESVLLLFNVIRTAVDVHLGGVYDVIEENLLADTLVNIRDILSTRAGKSSPRGRPAVERYYRLIRHLRTCSRVF